MLNFSDYSAQPTLKQFTIRLIMLLVMMLVGNILFFGLSGVLAITLWDVNIFASPQVLQRINNAEVVPVIRLFQAIQTIGMFLVPGIVWVILYKSPWQKGLRLKKSISIEAITGSLLLIIVAFPMINALAEFNEMMNLPEWLNALEKNLRLTEERAMQFMEALLKTSSAGTMLINIFIIGVIPAVSEEVLFRGVLQNEIESVTSKPILAVIIAAFIFSALHYQFFTFLPRFVLGIMMGLVYIWSRNLWVPIALHFFNNGLSVVAWYVFSPEIIEKEVDNIGTFSYMWPMALVSLGLVSLIMYGLNKHFQQNLKKQNTSV